LKPKEISPRVVKVCLTIFVVMLLLTITYIIFITLNKSTTKEVQSYSNVCASDTELLSQVIKGITEQDKKSMESLVGQIKSRQTYNQDSSCMYSILAYALMVGNPKEERAVLDQYLALGRSPRADFEQLGFNIETDDTLKTKVEYHEKLLKEAYDNAKVRGQVVPDGN